MKILPVLLAAAVLAGLGTAALMRSRSSLAEGTTRSHSDWGKLAILSPNDDNNVRLSDSQLSSVTIAPVTEHDFPTEMQEIGTINFDADQLV